MNLGKLQDTKLIYRNPLLLYTLIISYQKEKATKPIQYHIRKNKIPRNKLNQGGERPVL